MLKLAGVLLILFAYTSNANIAEGIVDSYLKAIGGKEKIEAVKNWELLIAQTSSMTNSTEDVVMKFKGDDAFYVQQKMQGKNNVFVYDGKKGWAIAPMMNMNDVTEIPAEMLPSLKASFEQTFKMVKGVFLDYKENGIKVDFLGKEKLGDVSVNKISISDPNDKEGLQKMFAYFDSKTKLISKILIETAQVKTAFIFKNFKEKDGLKHPQIIEIEMNGTVMAKLEVKSLNTNPKFDANTFAKPKK